MRFVPIATALALVLARPARGEEARLVLLHTADLHGALTSYDYLANRPVPRGLVRLGTLVDSARAEGHPTLLVDAGDAVQGGIELGRAAADRSPDPMMRAMSHMGYAAMAVGNHEFDRGLEALGRTREAATFPWLAANVVNARDGTPAFGASLVHAVGPFRVGVIGITTPAVPRMIDSTRIAGLRFLPPVEVARAEAARLRERERCDVVVIVAHTGLERERVGRAGGWRDRGGEPDESWGHRLATEVPGVDVIVLGHTHAVIESDTIGPVLVTQAGRDGQRLGRVDLTLERGGPAERWTVAAKRARTLAVSDSTATDSALASLAAPYHDAAQRELSREIGTAALSVDAPHGRYSDSAALDLIHQAQLQATGADVSLASLEDPTLRIGPGPVTVRDLHRLCPYDNTLGVVELSGAELAETLEHAARGFRTYTFETDRPLLEPNADGTFDSAEGVSYAIDLTRPPGRRVVDLRFRSEPLTPATRLRVAVNSYRMNGGGGFEKLRRAPRVSTSTRLVRDRVGEFVGRNRSIEIRPSGNWMLRPGHAAIAERPLVDLLVRRGVLDSAETMQIDPDAPARRADLARWLARAFDWRGRRSNAFPDVPDSLQPWVDGLMRRRVLGPIAEQNEFEPARVVTLGTVLDWCERAARAARFAVTAPTDLTYRASLLAGTRHERTSDPIRIGTLLGIVANTRYPTVRVLETTDFHGAILGGARRGGRPVGGTPVLAAHLERLRAENPQGTLLIDGGDCFQGTMISNLQFGRPVVQQMNLLGYAAAAIGNHEFDWTADTLARRVREERFAALGANMVERKGGRRPKWARSDTTVVRRGVRIGILGLCYRNTPTVTLAAHVAHLRFEDDSVTAARLAPRLRKRADVVLGVGHVPAESDSTRRALSGDLVRLARGIREVDAWFGGHSHNHVVDRVNDKPVLIAGSHGEVVAVCDLVVDPVANRVLESRIRLVQTFADEVTPDSIWIRRVASWNAEIEPIASQVIGRNARRLVRDRTGESALGNLVTDAIRAAVRADVAFQNSGGLRADLPEGPVTRGAIYEVMPFDNIIVTMDLTGAEIRGALESGLAHGRVAQVSGIRYTFDLRRPPGERLVSLTGPSGAPLDEAKVYRVACNDFMATGGDNFAELTQGRNLDRTGILIRDVLESYVVAASKDGGMVDVRPEQRIQRLGR